MLKYQIESELSKYFNEKDNNTNKFDTKIKISDRQKMILKLISQGETDISISIELGLHIGTIRYHKAEIFKKLNVGTSIEAVIKALKFNIISFNDL